MPYCEDASVGAGRPRTKVSTRFSVKIRLIAIPFLLDMNCELKIEALTSYYWPQVYSLSPGHRNWVN